MLRSSQVHQRVPAPPAAPPAARPAARRAAASLQPIDYVVCDVFSSRGLAGNQLAVFPRAGALSPGLRRALAREMNFSESVFVTGGPPASEARLAIHTPVAEIPFAGHPVLGTAAVLVDARDHDLVLQTGAGPVSVTVRSAGSARAEVWMDQPLPARFQADADRVRDALGVTAEVAVVGYDNGARYALVGLDGIHAVAVLAPDLGALAGLEYGVLCFAGAGLGWKARMFAPGVGVPEDPATGSAAGPLAFHLHSIGRLSRGATIQIAQGAEIGRPSLLRARITQEPGGRPRVSVGGHVVIVARGTFWLRPDDLEPSARGA